MHNRHSTQENKKSSNSVNITLKPSKIETTLGKLAKVGSCKLRKRIVEPISLQDHSCHLDRNLISKGQRQRRRQGYDTTRQ